MPTMPRTAGKRLRALREGLGLSMSDVEQLTRELAAVRRNPRLRVRFIDLRYSYPGRRAPLGGSVDLGKKLQVVAQRFGWRLQK
jgi:hypothetical protein